jgi:hypothetical protein
MNIPLAAIHEPDGFLPRTRQPRLLIEPLIAARAIIVVTARRLPATFECTDSKSSSCLPEDGGAGRPRTRHTLLEESHAPTYPPHARLAIRSQIAEDGRCDRQPSFDHLSCVIPDRPIDLAVNEMREIDRAAGWPAVLQDRLPQLAAHG